MRFNRTVPKCVGTRVHPQSLAGRPLWAVLFALLVSPAYAAFPNGYANCKVVTTRHTMVSGGADLANFPLTVILSDPDLKTTANGGLVNNASGYDIAFYPDCTGSGTALKWELESYSAATGSLVAHVLRPTLSAATDDTIGMFYGGSSSTFQSTPSAVWDSSYQGVWHLAGGTTVSASDSTSNANNGTLHSVSAATGQIDGGAALAGSDSSYIDFGNAASLVPTTTLTLSAWIKTSRNTGAAFIAGMWNDVADSGQRYVLYINNGIIGVVANAMNGDDNGILGPSVSDGNWHYIALTITNGANNEILYVDGTPVTKATPTGNVFSTVGAANNILVGRSTTSDGNDYTGTIDELRISTTVIRPADWILTEYRNQSAPAAYLSVGPRLNGNRVKHSVRTNG